MQDVEVEIRPVTEQASENDVRVLPKTSLIVTLNGKTSFNSVLLPKHALAVVMDYPPLLGQHFGIETMRCGWHYLPGFKYGLHFTGDPEKQVAHFNNAYMHDYVEVTRKLGLVTDESGRVYWK